MKVLVLGAGVVGTTTSYALARDGHSVTVVDRRSAPGEETSFANGGQLSASGARPWANPHVPRLVLKWLGKAEAPLVFRPRLDPTLWRWTIEFLANCLPARADRNMANILRLALLSRDALASIVAETQVGFEHRSRGILHVFRDRATFDDAAKDAAQFAKLGLPFEVIERERIRQLEPALAPALPRLAGATYCPDDQFGDAHLFTVELARRAADMGVDFRFDCNVTAITADGDRIGGVLTDHGRLDADLYVLAFGSYSPLLTRPLGLRLPIVPAKGYSATVPIVNRAAAPSLSVTDEDAKVVITPLGDRLRIAGTAEFGGYDTTLNERRARSVLMDGLDLFPGASVAEQATLWTGLRPLTPDGAPIIGPSPYRNLLLNTGHGTLGWTLSAGSAHVIARLAAGKEPGVDLTGLTLARFR
ncbi:MAG: D-amino acid dehydrogenase [Gemmatimonas sp.]